MSTRARRVVAAAATLALLGLVGAACSAGSGDSGNAGGDAEVNAASGPADDAAEGGAAAEPAPEVPQGAQDRAAADSDALLDGAFSATQQAGEGAQVEEPAVRPGPEPGDPRSLIKKGNVALRSTDVEDTLFDVRKVLAKNGGEVAEDATQADDEGEAETALLTVRVPVDNFDTALEDLKTVGEDEGVELIDSSSTTTDVSTQVIDVGVRVELQRRSIDRISILLDRATSIRDIVGIERELARREADLGSLQKRQAFLADQSSMSTITISVERPREKPEPKPKPKAEPEDEEGFVAGLKSGWDAFQNVTTGLLTGAGALLPFAIVALLVGIPLRVWLRRRQAPGAVGTPEAQLPAGA